MESTFVETVRCASETTLSYPAKESRRIGVTRAADSLLRFYVRGNWFVSGPRTLNR